MKKFYRTLSEKDKRRYAGVEALKLERGGIVYIASLFGCDRKTVSKGIEELKKFSRRHVDQQRIRRRGAGRKPYHMIHEHIDEQFLNVLNEHTAGDPMREAIKWTNLTPQEICQLLEQKHNRRVSKTVVRQIMDKHNYHRRKILKKKTMKEVAYRNQQFETIAGYKALYLNSPNPIISMDNKKKEYLGNFYRNGYLYTQRALHCYDHDFPSFAEGIIITHGIYDTKQNKGYIHLGTSHETSEFSCECLKDWWFKHGRYDYPNANVILILCDGGGSNSSRHYIFKQDLQKLVNEIGIAIRIAHYPPYCSKWNPIEHKLFPHVTRACQGVLFENIEIVQSLMQKTKTRQGLEVEVEILDKVYQTGRKATDDFRQNMGISFDESLPSLNYTVIPSGEVI
ncbi:MAG: ISAzo13 family transposase [Nitrospirae bacterium]|nr:ISAzo13 family transposase [Nitrospirota bacterium]